MGANHADGMITGRLQTCLETEGKCGNRALFVAMRGFAWSTTCGLRESGAAARKLVAVAADRCSDMGNPLRSSWNSREPCPDPDPPSLPRNDGVSPENRRPTRAIRIDGGGAFCASPAEGHEPRSVCELADRYRDESSRRVSAAHSTTRVRDSSVSPAHLRRFSNRSVSTNAASAAGCCRRLG